MFRPWLRGCYDAARVPRKVPPDTIFGVYIQARRAQERLHGIRLPRPDFHDKLAAPLQHRACPRGGAPIRGKSVLAPIEGRARIVVPDLRRNPLGIASASQNLNLDGRLSVS